MTKNYVKRILQIMNTNKEKIIKKKLSLNKDLLYFDNFKLIVSLNRDTRSINLNIEDLELGLTRTFNEKIDSLIGIHVMELLY